MSQQPKLLLILVLLLALQACGQTGELYWPDDTKTAVEEDTPEDGAS